MTCRSSVIKYLAGLILCVLASLSATAQNADFTADKTGGCSPLDIRFTNKSTGLSSNADFKWEFGNGNTSTLVSPGTTYKQEKTYTVKLTATDAGKTYTKTMDIIVYKVPQVNFDADISKGCLPLLVNYTSNSVAGDGTISSYFWDFGDGATQAGNQQIGHTYSTPQTVTAGLTVTNSYGCYSTVTKSAVVKVLPAIIPAFNANQTVLCKITDAATFNNTSTGPGTLNYAWDFGDGKTATDKSPSHVYDIKGIYTIKLTVQSSEGCSAEITKNAYLNAANFNTDFEAPMLICENTAATFTDKSNPAAPSQIWLADGSSYYGNGSFTYTPARAGSFEIKLINTYGTCADTAAKNITVKASPKIDGFTADMQGVCGSPVSIKFNDTSKSAVKWEWDFNYNYYNFNPTAFTQATSYTYTNDNSYQVNLKITNTDGCSSSAIKNISIFKANAYISSSNNYTGCETLTTTFSANSTSEIKEYNWFFSDNTTSNDAKPQHIFSGAGNYSITLNYTNTNGCKGTAITYVTVYAKPVFDFKALPDSTVCGNSPVTFTATGTNFDGSYYKWNFGDNTSDDYIFTSSVTHQYFADTSYTVRLIISNGTCVDTVIKNNFIKVRPPFPKISAVTNTCDNTRGMVAFTETSQKATQWSWDFGDNNPLLTYTQPPSAIKHLYTKPGAYKVVLTATNGGCSVRDSTTAYVLLKQNPVLASIQTEVCSNLDLNTTISALDTNPVYSYYYNYDYSLAKIEYGDSSVFNGSAYSPDYIWRNTYHLNLTKLDVSKQDLRIITQSYYFNCADTTNFIPVKIKGPLAGFTIAGNSVCFKSPVIIKDTSTGSHNVGIDKWEWNYGDGTSETLTQGGVVSHKYDNPGGYYVSLKVTDKDGCTASVQNYNYVTVKGPKADFSMSPNPVSPDNTVYFNNYTNTSNTNYYDNHYTWLFGDGTSSNEVNYVAHFYSVSGVDTVMLIAANEAEHCSDTAVQYLHIKNINLAYTYSLAFINPGSGCPPVLASFTNTSINAARVTWDFGDGVIADNLDHPSHTYQKPGVYKVTLYGYFDNGTIDSTFDYITIKGPYATLMVNHLFSCGAQAITFTAEAKNTSSFTWDFGDGTLLDIPDTFAVHQYLTPGVYTPALIVRDGSGCSFPFFMDDKIVIDTLHFTITKTPAVICNPALVSFTPEIVSIAKNELQQSLQYFWDFGTGGTGDTSVLETPSFVYDTAGNFAATLTILSPYGCIEQVTDTLIVKAKEKGIITGPAEICEHDYATFTATANNSTDLEWQWQFANNGSSAAQNPPAQLFADTGINSIRLIVNNKGCYDTTNSQVNVHGKPRVNVTPKDPPICLGDSIQLQAHDGKQYTWYPPDHVSDTAISNPFVSPKTNTRYFAEVTNGYGCTSRDSVWVQVIQPFIVTADTQVHVCRGNSVQLHAQGADKYLWIDGAGLSNTKIGDPIATVNTNKDYSVVGYDNYGCFTDTAITRLKIAELPVVNAGSDVTVLAGTNVPLQAVASSDVVKWTWQPADYLSCTNCSTPVSTPRGDITYVAEVTNTYGCTKKDSITINIICRQSLVFIPTGFTPNGDGINERFSVKGNGIKLIKHFVIYDRWGEAVFEKNNVNSNDPDGSWDGLYKGSPAPPGSYVYLAEIICDAGEIFTYRGAVILIR